MSPRKLQCISRQQSEATEMKRIYLDNNATTPLRPQVKASMLAALETAGNASSIHAEGRNARAILEAARADIASLTGAAPDEVIFTSGGTEANSLALHGLLQAASLAGQRFTRLIVSAIEHPSVLQTAEQCAEVYPGLRLTVAPVDANGSLDLARFERLLAEGKGRALVSVMAVNNETGVIQPTQDVARICNATSATLHCDAVQAAGRIPATLEALGADIITISAHKLGGPQGVGALIKRTGVPLSAQIRGGMQEFGYRAGTHDVAAIAGFGAAARAVSATAHASTLRDILEGKLLHACPEAVIFGRTSNRVGNTICIATPSVTADTMLIALDLEGFAVSAGAACSSGKVSHSHVLAAMGVDPELARCAIRISLGWKNDEQDVPAFVAAYKRIVERARARAAA